MMLIAHVKLRGLRSNEFEDDLSKIVKTENEN